MTDSPYERRSSDRRRELGAYPFAVRSLALIPMLTAALAVVCVLRRPDRRWLWAVAALAAVNVALTPFSSGEWFYQRREEASYQQAVATGDFTGFHDLLSRHDPHLLPRMMALAAALMVSLAVFAVLAVRADRDRPASRAVSAIVAGSVLLPAAATLFGVCLLFT